MLGIIWSLLFCLLPVGVHAQGYPKQPINLIVPLAPGDATDVAGRTIAKDCPNYSKYPLSPSIGQAPAAPSARTAR